MKKFGQTWSWWALCAAFAMVPANAVAESRDTDDNKRFVRITNNSSGEPTSLQTSVSRYVGKYKGRPIVVDLVGAVHLADEAYYKQLNKLFRNYDAVLYEFVAPEGFEVPDPAHRSANPISFLQQSLQSMLGLASQLEHVDYKPKNFVHADMSPREMSEAMRERGDNMFTFMLSAMADIARQANAQAAQLDEDELEAFDPIAMLTDAQAGQKLKIQMAKQFDRMGDTNMALGATINTLIVEDRNQAAMKVLREQLGRGRQRMAIFYGAAHMNDFQRRLQQDYGLRHVGTEWLTAWDLEAPAAAKTSLTSLLFQALQHANELQGE